MAIKENNNQISLELNGSIRSLGGAYGGLLRDVQSAVGFASDERLSTEAGAAQEFTLGRT